MGVYPFFTSASQGESAVTGGCAGVAWLVVSKFSIDEFNELMLPIPGRLFAHGWGIKSPVALPISWSAPARSLLDQHENKHPSRKRKKKKIKREKPW